MPQWKRVIAWPEFRVVWFLLPIIIAAGAIAGIFLSPPISWVEIGLLAGAFIFVAVSIYNAVTIGHATSIERSELKSIAASVNDGLIVYSRDFKAVFFNPAAERIFKLQEKDVMGHIFSPQDVEKAGWKILAQIIFPSLAPRVMARSKESDYLQIVDVSFTEPQLEFRVTTVPVIDEQGNTLAFLKIIRDRTAQIAALKSRSEFITIASHQLHGPVTDINWALQTLMSSVGMDETNKMIIENAAAASQNLLQRIDDLLNIAKMEDGQFGYNFEDTDIESFVGKILGDILPAAKKTGIKLYFDRPTAPLPHVMVDPKRLSLAFVNILENAIRYNVENGEVIVSIDAVPGKPLLAVKVKDTGIGIPPDALARIFTKFYRADNALKLQTEGSGLGLYITKNIISAHGGEIWIDSELNRGTTVSFALPTDPNLVPKREVGLDDLF